MNNIINPFLLTDGYKTGHHIMYPDNTTLVYSNFTPRSNKHAPKGCDKVVSFGQNLVMQYIKEIFDEGFFRKERITNTLNFISFNYDENEAIPDDDIQEVMTNLRDEVMDEIKREYSMYLGTDYDVSHIEALWDLGYLPIEVKALPEGVEVPMGVPVLTIVNTLPEFYWLTNFLETLISNLLWKPMTSATIARQYKKLFTKYAIETDLDNVGFVEFQGHDFSMRGLDSVFATMTSGLGHATSFKGSDSLPVIHAARKYYNESDFVVGSVNATEHSVMCAGSKEDEIGTFRRLMQKFPTGILSVVSDTWDLWKVLTEYLPEMKDEIMSRDGKLVIRPDSGDPVDIICGKLDLSLKYLSMGDLDDFNSLNFRKATVRLGFNSTEDLMKAINDTVFLVDKGKVYSIDTVMNHDIYVDYIRGTELFSLSSSQSKGVVELLWDIFGGTINEQGYKVLDPHIGAIYGDSITLDRAEQIMERLKAKGFASTNVVLGIGSFTYQYNTRDTFGFAMKATYCEVMPYCSCKDPNDIFNDCLTGCVPEGREIFKDPITDDGTKKSAKGLLYVGQHEYGYYLEDQVSWKQEMQSCLETIFLDGDMMRPVLLTEIREKLN
jgi:nicotinic acid phosphoribosyltransferase